MFATGLISGTWGYALGREGLKGVKQPDVRPASSVGESTGNQTRGEDLVLLKEEEILKSVKARMEGNNNDSGASN